MNALIFAQTLFYLTVSFAIIALSVLFGIVTYHLIAIARNLDRLSENLNTASEEIKGNIQDIISQLSKLPFLSFLLKKGGGHREHGKKGRKTD